MRRRGDTSDEGWLLSYADLITNLLIFFVLLLSAASVSTSRMQQIAQSVSGKASPASLESIGKEIDKTIAERNLQDRVETELTPDGLEISINSGLMFDPGSAVIRPELLPVLEEMMQVVVPYHTRYHFAVEGHTDSTPIIPGAQFESNWALSSARALVVRDRLEAAGIEAKRMRVEGYADTKPLPEDRLAGLDNNARLARHRRVVVRIY